MARNDEQPKQWNDPFSKMMFPSRQGETEAAQDNSAKVIPSAGSIDYMQLMEHVDALMSAYDGIKPAFKKVTPAFSSLLSKFVEKK